MAANRTQDTDAEPMPFRTKILAGAFVLLVVLAGGYFFLFVRKPGMPRVYPTEGVVLFQGKPAVGARVTLLPDDQSRSSHFLPSGVVGEDGVFRLTTFKPDDGAPAGRYRVRIHRSRLDGDEIADLKKKNSPEEFDRIMAEKAEDPLYSKFLNSDLKAEIPAPGKQLRFELE